MTRTTGRNGSAQPAPPRATPEHRLFLQALDALTEGLAFFDLAARLLHANRAYRDAAAEDSPGNPLRAELGRFVDALTSRARAELHSASRADDGVRSIMEQEVSSPRARYRLRGSYIGFDLFGSGATLLVTLHRSQDPLPLSDEALQERFGLSRRECSVARLIAAGRSNREVAEALGISPNTARNHTSHVLAKLGARSRAEVGPRLRGEGADTEP